MSGFDGAFNSETCCIMCFYLLLRGIVAWSWEIDMREWEGVYIT